MINRNYKQREEAFDKLLTQYTAKDPTFNTEGWRSYFKSLASRESNFQATIPNRIGAYGYFQLMPANQKRSRDSKSNPGAQFEDVFDLTRANLNYLKNHMTPQDYAKAQAMGIDIYGLAAGAHLGGAQGMLNYIRSGNNPQDYNGTKISHYARDFSQNSKIKTNAQLGNWSVEGQAVRFEDVANGTSVLTGDTPQAPLLAVISNMNNALSDDSAVIYQQPDTTEESLNVWRSRIPKDIVVEETQPTQDASKIQDNNKNTQQKETQFKSLVSYGVPKQIAQQVPVQYVEDPLTTVQNVWDTYNNIYDELFSRDTFKERERALGGPINTNNPIQNFSYFKGQLPVVRYSYGGELDNSVIPSSNSVKPNLFYGGGDTMTSQFLDQVLADREANQLRNEELAAQYNFSPQAISDIQQGKDVNVYTPDVVVTGKAPSVGFYPYGYHTVDKFYQDNPSGLMEDAGSFVPFVGDGMEVSNIANDLRQGNYGQAGLGLSLLALPNIIEKPLKFLAKNGYKIAGRAANMIKDELTPLYYNYKYGKKATKDMYDDFLHGKSYPEIMGIGKQDIRPLGMKSQQELMRDVVDRNSEIYKLVGVPEETINKYREQAKNIMGNIRVGRYTDTQYKTAGRESQGGFYAKSTDPFFISINRYSRIPTSKSILHETRHALDYLLDRTSQYSPTAYGARKLDRAKSIQESLLTNAYDQDFIDLPTTKYADSLAGYPLMEGEKITTNLDSRNELLKLLTNTESLDINNLRAVNQAIDAASDDEIFWAVSKSNGYGSRYIKFLKDNNKLTPEKAQQFRQAMKYVGASTAPVGIWTTTATSQDNKQHAFGGFLNKFSGEEDNYTQQMNTPNIFRKKDGTYVYQSSPQSDEISVEPINTVFENPSQWTYRDQQGRLYTPRESAFNQGTITQGNNEGPIVSAVNNYLRELQYKWDNNIPIDGKYTIPAIAATAALPLLGEAAYPILTNPYVDAGITSAFGAHGLNHAINEGVDGYGDAAMTAMEIAPLGRVIRPMFNIVPNIVKPLTNRINWLYNDGNIFNAPMRYTPNNYYREVSKEAIDDAVNSGVVRTGNPNKHIGPYFGKGNTPWHRKNYIIEGYPENNEWIYAIPYENAYRVSLDSPTEGIILKQRALSKRVPTAANYVEAFPYTNGSINTTPTTNFSYWRKYPLLGWRKHSFVNVKTPTITAENAASITPEQWTPEQWTVAQDAAIAKALNITPEEAAFLTEEQWKNAIARGVNVDDAQRLKDLHFVTKAEGNKIIDGTNPLDLYHNTNNEFNSFDMNKAGRTDAGYYGKGVYTSPLYPESRYGNTEMHLYGYAKNPLIIDVGSQLAKDAEMFYNRGYHSLFEKYSQELDKLKRRKTEFDLRLSKDSNNEVLQRMQARKIANQRRGLNNLLKEYPDDSYLQSLSKHDGDIEIQLNYWLMKNKMREVGLGEFTRKVNLDEYDAVVPFRKDIYERYPQVREAQEIMLKDGRQLKSADAVTFDDNGIRIPLGKRDNFNRNDIRYGFIPPVAAGLGLSLYNQDNQMQHSLGGHLNKFEEGGNTDDTKYQAFLEDLKNHAPNLAAPSRNYNMRRYWELRGKPSNWAEAQRDFNYLYNVKEDPMFTLENDGAYHAPSTAFNQDTGIYEFMKSADHPTVKYELNWYDNGDETMPNGLRIPSFEGFKSSQNFKKNYELQYSPIENKYYYVPRANKKVEGGGIKRSSQ